MKALSVAATAIAAVLTQAPASAQPSSIVGLWDAAIVANDVEVPFRFEIGLAGGVPQGSFFEGDRKVGSTSGTYSDGVLTLDYDFLNTTLQLKSQGDELIGTYQNKRPGAKPQTVRMRHFKPVSLDDSDVPALEGTWEMRRVAAEVTAPRDTRTWHVFLRQSGAELSGSILRIDGDTGTLTGRWSAGKLRLSHFAGERPNLFEATQNSDGTLAVTLNGKRLGQLFLMEAELLHALAVPTGALNEGDRLDFELEVDRRGKYAAVNLQSKAE